MDENQKKATEIENAMLEADADIADSAIGHLPVLTVQLGSAVIGVCDDLKLSRRQRILVVASILSALTEGEESEFQYAIAAVGRFYDLGRELMRANASENDD